MISYITYQQFICYNTSSILLIIKISDVFTNFLIVKEVKYQIILLLQLRYKVQNIAGGHKQTAYISLFSKLWHFLPVHILLYCKKQYLFILTHIS